MNTNANHCICKKMDNIEISENVILIRINQLYHENITEEELYEATRGIWRVGIRRENADYAFSVFKGEVKEVFAIKSWFPACTLPYKTRNLQDAISKVKIEGRWEFKGELAEDNIRNKYIEISVKHYLPYGASNPITYINC